MTVSIRNLYFHFVNIVFKIALFYVTIRENHATVTMLDTSNPFALVATSVCPVHLSVTVTFIILIFPFVNVTTSPHKLPKSALSIIYIVAFVAVRLGSSTTAPLSFSMLHSRVEIANVDCAVRPSILAFAVWFTVLVFTCVRISVDE